MILSSSTAEITEQVNSLMHEVFEISKDKLHAEAKLFEDLSLDSLDAVDMMVHLEDKIGFKVDAEKFRKVTFEDIEKGKNAPPADCGVDGFRQECARECFEFRAHAGREGPHDQDRRRWELQKRV
mgnify:CR=1 FL=1